MKLEVLNITIHDDDCNESLSFSATLVVNDKPIARLHDTGEGSGITITPIDKKEIPMIHVVAAFCNLHYTLSLDNDTSASTGGPADAALMNFIEHQVHMHIQQKMLSRLHSRLLEAMETSIVYGWSDGRIRVMPLDSPIGQLLKSAEGTLVVEQALKQIVPYLEPGEFVLNQNIPFFLMRVPLQ
ncbi:hypothetical protein [[Flexibacter] sp. ATCC 35208]|uniref:hypothetical protein n=1 Tax=[Flexibacter] sp. ATCC 35208 TaxID=1936242 RepID=UPI00117CB0E2|nr:hypothetical protein [[Flexibacter] sp. ATCC 35208]